MKSIGQRWRTSLTRRNALAGLAGMLVGLPRRARAQLDPRDLRDHHRVPSLSEMVDAFDFEPICGLKVLRGRYDYTVSGADSEWTKRRNRHAFDWVEIVERRGVGTEDVDASTEILGVPMEYPILVSPTSTLGWLHPTSDRGAYQASTSNGTLFCVAHGASTPHPKIAQSSTGPRWHQLYPSREKFENRERLEMYQDLGARAVLITVDQQATFFERGQHNRWLHSVDDAPPEEPTPLTERSGSRRYAVEPRRLWYTWDAMARLRDLCSVPMIVKGILTAEDAEICVERGFDGIVVSNHGGRSLDYSPSTLEVLPEIVDAVRGRITVLVDSGFRRGSDVFKALALGADAVCLGRAPRWGLGAFGPAGFERVLEIFQEELREAMARAGRRTLADIDRTAVKVRFP